MISKSERAFTLIELMVSITIVAILAATGLIIYNTSQKAARDSKRIQDITEAQKAVEQFYYTNNNTYPAGSSCCNAILNTINSMNNNTYFSTGRAPVDPTSTGTFVYRYYWGGTSCTIPKFFICARLENTSRGNSTTLATDGCTPPVSGSGQYYCLGALSN